MHRHLSAELGVPIRPRMFQATPKRPREEEDDEAEAVGGAQQSSPSSTATPSSPATPTETFYLKCIGGIRGVLQLHKALLERKRACQSELVSGSLFSCDHDRFARVPRQILKGTSICGA